LPWLLQWYVPLFTILSGFMGYVIYTWINILMADPTLTDQYPFTAWSPVAGILGFLCALGHCVLAVAKIRGLRMHGRIKPKMKGEDGGLITKSRSARDNIEVGMKVNYSSRSHSQWYSAEVVAVEPFVSVEVELFETVGYKARAKSAVTTQHQRKLIAWNEISKRLRKPVDANDDRVLLIISMPALFIVMAVQSTIRGWDMIECEAKNLTRTDICVGEHTVGQVEAFYDVNFDFANLCQYYVVFLFTRLCWKFLRGTVNPSDVHVKVDKDEILKKKKKKLQKKQGCCPCRKKKSLETIEIDDDDINNFMLDAVKLQRKNLKRTTFQGVHWWCALGAIQLLLNGFYSLYQNWYEVKDQDEDLHKLYLKANESLKLIFSPFTFLCIYNMIWVCNSPVINDSLQGANAKFLGTRMLVLVSQFQLTALSAIPKVLCLPESENPLSKYVPDMPMLCSAADTNAKVKMIHSSLLTVEAWIIVIFNIFAWSWNVDFRTTFLDLEDNAGKTLQDELDDSELDHIVNQLNVSKEQFKELIASSNLMDILRRKDGMKEDAPPGYVALPPEA